MVGTTGNAGTTEQRLPVSAVQDGTTTKKLEADHFGSIAGGLINQIISKYT